MKNDRLDWLWNRPLDIADAKMFVEADIKQAAIKCTNELKRVFTSGFFENHPEILERVRKVLGEYDSARQDLWKLEAELEAVNKEYKELSEQELAKYR